MITQRPCFCLENYGTWRFLRFLAARQPWWQQDPGRASGNLRLEQFKGRLKAKKRPCFPFLGPESTPWNLFQVKFGSHLRSELPLMFFFQSPSLILFQPQCLLSPSVGWEAPISRWICGWEILASPHRPTTSTSRFSKMSQSSEGLFSRPKKGGFEKVESGFAGCFAVFCCDLYLKSVFWNCWCIYPCWSYLAFDLDSWPFSEWFYFKLNGVYTVTYYVHPCSNRKGCTIQHQRCLGECFVHFEQRPLSTWRTLDFWRAHWAICSVAQVSLKYRLSVWKHDIIIFFLGNWQGTAGMFENTPSVSSFNQGSFPCSRHQNHQPLLTKYGDEPSKKVILEDIIGALCSTTGPLTR